MQADYARTITIGGGGSILLGTLSLVAVAGLVGQSGYDPRLWAAPIASFALGGALIPAGIEMRKRALAKMEKVRDAVDPLRQKGGKLSMVAPSEDDLQPLARRARPQPSIPQPLVSLTRDNRGNAGTVLGLAWSIRY